MRAVTPISCARVPKVWCDVCLPRGTAGPVTPSLLRCGSLYPQCPWNVPGMESMLLGVGVGLCRQRREQAANGTEDDGQEQGQGLERDPRPGNLAGLSQPCGQAAKSTHDTLRPGGPRCSCPRLLQETAPPARPSSLRGADAQPCVRPGLCLLPPAPTDSFTCCQHPGTATRGKRLVF